MADDEVVAIVAHDAGGAEILSSLTPRLPGKKLLVVAGPARKVFERKLGPLETTDLTEAIEKCSWVLCGTSWQSDIEWRATDLARMSGKHCVAFLDHWVNYRERFERDGEQRLPDEIWVADPHAARLAKDNFPRVPIVCKGNPYFDDMIKELKGLEQKRAAKSLGQTVLYICEPISEHALIQLGNVRQMGYIEDEAVEYFLQNIRLIADRVDRIIMRPHPSEPLGKYSWVLDISPVPIQISTDSELITDLAQADVVVGCESMAMVIAILAHKRVVCSIPPGGRSCALPYREIQSLRAMVDARAS